MSFGSKLREYREAKGYTQEQLAQMIGVAKTTITGYERGNRSPDVSKIKKLAAALGVTGDDLLDTGIEAIEKPQYSSEAMRFAQNYERLDKHEKQIIQRIMNDGLSEADMQLLIAVFDRLKNSGEDSAAVMTSKGPYYFYHYPECSDPPSTEESGAGPHDS